MEHFHSLGTIMKSISGAWCLQSPAGLSAGLVWMFGPRQLHPDDLHRSPPCPSTSPAKLRLVCLFYLDVYLWNVWRQINPLQKNTRLMSQMPRPCFYRARRVYLDVWHPCLLWRAICMNSGASVDRKWNTSAIMWRSKVDNWLPNSEPDRN